MNKKHLTTETFLFYVGRDHLIAYSEILLPDVYARITYSHKSKDYFIIDEISFNGTRFGFINKPINLLTEINECIKQRLEAFYLTEKGRVISVRSLSALIKKIKNELKN